MIKPFEFYFDFVSPYSFLAHKEIGKIEKINAVKIKYMPILLGGLHNLAGIKAPGFIPIKAKYYSKRIRFRRTIKFIDSLLSRF